MKCFRSKEIVIVWSLKCVILELYFNENALPKIWQNECGINQTMT